MPDRKLAHIEKIVDIQPIPGADNIVKATVLGWECVVKKGAFKIGDWCIYIEIDSMIKTDKNWSKFLEDKHKPGQPARIKTRKYLNQISQGLCLPVDIQE